MSGSDAVSDKATPRPWKFVPWHVEEGPPAVRAGAAFGPIVCTTSSDADAALIVAAVNSYDESRALLKEAVDMIDRYAKSMRTRRLPDHKQQDLIARLRAHLGE